MITKQCHFCSAPVEVECDFASVGVLCDACEAKYEREQRYKGTQQILKLRFERCVGAGLLPLEFRETSFTNSKPEVEAANATSWADARKWDGAENLFIYGDVGTGKTYMGLCCLRRQFAKEKACVNISARRLLKDSERFDEGQGTFKAALHAHFVLLDDIDKAQPTERRLEALWEFFDERQRGGKKTIVTANIKPDALVGYFASQAGANSSTPVAIVDRIRPVQVLKLEGDSQRGAV